MHPSETATEQVAVHAGRGLEVRAGDQVLGLAVPHAKAPDRCLVDHAALPIPCPDRRDPAAVRRPCRRAPRLAASARRELAHPLRGHVDHVDVGAPAQVGVPVPVRDERDALPIGRPARVGVVVVATGQQLGVARSNVDEPQALELVVDEAGAVELVDERVDEPRVGRRRVVRLSLGLLLRLRRDGGAHDAKAAAIGRPCQPFRILGQVGQLSRFAAIGERKEPDLRASVLGRLGLARLGAAATGLQHAAAVRQEGKRPAVGAPARSGVGLAAGGQLAGRDRAVGRRDPGRAAIAVLARRDRLDGKGDPAPIRRELELSRDAQVVQIPGARGTDSHGSVVSCGVAGEVVSLVKQYRYGQQ